MTELKASLVLQLKNMLRGGIAQVRGELKGLKSEAQGLGSIKEPNAAGMAAYGRSAREASQAVRELKRNQAALGAGVGSGNTILAGTGRTALMLGGVYGGAQATRAVVSGTVGQSISFEKAFAQVRKKVDPPDEAGFRDLEQRINRIAVEYGLARAQVAELVAEAGAAGIAYQDLERFMRMTAKAAVAWDMSPQEASQSLAYIKAGTQMTIAEMEVLANKINGLGDNSAAKERDIVEMFLRSGAAAKAAGVNFDVTLAALTAVRSTGLQPEIASRWFSAFTGGLATIDSGTKKQQAGLKLIGLTSKQVSEGMKRDSVGTMIDVFKRLEESPVKAKAALEIFGKEWWDEVSRAGQALPEFRKQLEYLRSGKWGGSLDKTLGIELATTANHLERFKALVSEIGDRMGRWALPPLNSTIDGLIKKFDELQERLANRPPRVDPSENPQWADGQDPSQAGDVRAVKRAVGNVIGGMGEWLFGKKLTKDPSREISAKLLGSAADAEALATKQTEEAALLRIQARNSKAKPDRARLTLEAQKKEQEAQANADAAARARRAAGQASARDMTNVEGGEQHLPGRARSESQREADSLRSRIAELEAQKARTGINPFARQGGQARSGAIDEELKRLQSRLKELEGDADRTGSAVKDKLTLDLTSQGTATAMSWANGLRAGVPAVEAAANALRAPIMTPPAGVPSAPRPITGGGASAPVRPTNVQVAGIHIHGVQDPEKAARIAETRLASAIRGALAGAHHDGVT